MLGTVTGPRPAGALPSLGRFIVSEASHPMATAAGASTRLFWEAGGVRHPLENCSTGCLNERLDPCVDAVRVSQRYVESLAAGGPFRCEYDWPPWPEHLMPKVHFSPPQMAHVAPGSP